LDAVATVGSMGAAIYFGAFLKHFTGDAARRFFDEIFMLRCLQPGQKLLVICMWYQFLQKLFLVS
jgi:hypothetical protein